MKILKIVTCLAVAAVAALPAAAQDEFYALLYPAATEFNVAPGETFDLTLNLNNNQIVSSFQYYIDMPEGVSVVEELEYDITYDERLNTTVYEADAMMVKDTNAMLFYGYCKPKYNVEKYDSYKIQVGEGPFVTIKFETSAEMAHGDYKMTIYSIKFVTMAEDYYVSPDAVIKIHVDEEAGIENVTAEDCRAEYYNLQGLRVEPTAPGLYIRRTGSKTTKVIL